ncbi:MAG: hypothetical protein WKF84_20435 [Pyrinomonadaceae bacterium]
MAFAHRSFFELRANVANAIDQINLLIELRGEQRELILLHEFCGFKLA